MAILKKGSKGAKVKKLQEDLKLLEYAVGTPDGDFGPRTVRAVKKFQTDTGLAADGKVGPSTQAKLKEKVDAKKAATAIQKASEPTEEETSDDDDILNALPESKEGDNKVVEKQVSSRLTSEVFFELKNAGNLLVIHLNPIVNEKFLEEENLQYLFPKNDLEWEENKQLMATLNNLKLNQLAKPKTQQQSMKDYMNKRTGPIGNLFSFFQRTIQADLATGKKISLAGNDFNKQAILLATVANEIHAALREVNFSLADQLNSSVFATTESDSQRNKYQATIMIDKRNYKIKSMTIFYTDEIKVGASIEQDLRMFTVGAPTFKKTSALHTPFVNRYLEKIDYLAKLGSSDLKMAENLLSCGFKGYVNESRLGALDYLQFSKIFRLGITDDTTELEQRKNREDISLDVSGFTKTINSTVDAFKELTADTRGSGSLMPFSFDSEILSGINTEELKAVWEDALLRPFLLKICPPTLPRRVLECLLPSDCRDIIKYIGLWRTRDYIETFSLLDTLSPSLTGLTRAFDRWDNLVQERYNFKAVELEGGGLKSGTFDGKTLFESDSKAMNISVSLLLRTHREQFEKNKEKEKAIFSQEGTFSIRKSKLGNLKFKIYSKAGKEAEYSTTGTNINIFDDLWHQLGFSWNGQAGVLTVYIDGIAIPTKLVSGTGFKGPLRVKSDSQIIVASERTDSMHKPFFGQLDEICIFAKTLSSREWQSISIIDTNENLNTLGLSQYAKAWWRMGDSTGDTLVKNAPGGKIIDIISQIDLVKIPDQESKSRVIVCRLFKEEEEDTFIDILSQETDLLQLCDRVYETILKMLDTGFNLDEVKLGLERQFQIPTFNKDPHGEIKVVIEKVIIESLIRTFSKMLLDTLQKYLLDCQNWKTLLKAATKSAFNTHLDRDGPGGAFTIDPQFSPLADYAKSGTPLGNLIQGINDSKKGDHSFWRELANESAPYLQEAHNTLSNVANISVTPTDGGVWSTSLGLGRVNYQENPSPGSKTSGWSDMFDTDDSDIAISNQSASPDSEVIIEIISSTSQAVAPAELLELFSSRGSQSSIDKVSDIINKNYPDNQFTDADIEKMFGNFGDALGVQNSINMLIEAAQRVNTNSDLPSDFCLPGQNFSDRMGLRPSRTQRAMDKASVREILDSAEQMNPNLQPPCPEPIPLSEFETKSLKNTINDVYSSVTMAYDNDLLLYRLGMTSITEVREEIPKVLWKGDKAHKNNL